MYETTHVALEFCVAKSVVGFITADEVKEMEDGRKLACDKTPQLVFWLLTQNSKRASPGSA